MTLLRRAGLTVLALLTMHQAAYAQDDAPGAGAIVGFNSAYFASSPKNDGSSKPGLVLGAFALLRKDKMLKIQPEIQFAQRRADVLFNKTSVGFSTNYLNLSLMTRLKLFKNLYSTQGPQFSFPLRSKMDLGTSKVDIKDNVNWDFSIPAGVGVQAGRMGIEGRWESGLKRVEKGPLGNFIKRNRAITVFATIGF